MNRPRKLLLCIIIEACQVGDYGSYYHLMHSDAVAAPSLAEYSKGSNPLCGVSPFGTSTVEKPGAVSLHPALAAGLRLNPLPLFV